MKTAHGRKSKEEQLQEINVLKEEFTSTFSSSLPIKKDDVIFQNFREFYNSAFSRIAGGEKKIASEVAVKAWKFLLEACTLVHTELWLDFIANHYTSSINKDAWTMSFDFLESTDKDFSNYNSSSFWPVVVDDFVEYVNSKNQGGGKDKPKALEESSNNSSYFSKDLSSSFPSSGARGEFAGLKNQGATCYLNSFLQAQFMTPEFRNGIYQFDCSSNYQTFPIPYQLQRLFGKLQLTKKKAVSTRALTKSFGWTLSDSFTQHDVQELSHVLFDALEESLASTKQENLINNLYQGTLIDYVRCQTCNFQSQRSDKYLDISLDIHDVYTLEGALRKYIQPEILSGSSQWKCPKCNKLVDAVKGLSFESFPYILVTHLKRFDFNWTTNQRVKLGHKVSFPFILDLQPFKGSSNVINNSNSNTSGEKSSLTYEEEKSISLLRKQIDRLTEDINSDDNLHQNRFHLVDFWRSERKKLQKELDILLEKLQKEGKTIPGIEIKSSSQPQTPAKMVTKDAEYKEGNYELYSVLVHSGSAMGGHYYAYIKSFDKTKWYNFNDYTVTEIPFQEIERSFGEYSNSQYSSTAYVLLYRRIDSSRNINSVADSKVPELAKQPNKLKEKGGSSKSNLMDIDENIELGAGKKEVGGKSELSNHERDKPIATVNNNNSNIGNVNSKPVDNNNSPVIPTNNTNESTLPTVVPKVEPQVVPTKPKTNFYGMDSGDEANEEDEEEEDDSVSITFYTAGGKSHSTVVSVNETTLQQLLEVAKALFNLSEPLDQIRFRQYNVKAKYPTDPIEGEHEQYLIEVGIENNINLFVETRKESEKFPTYDRSIVTFRVILFNEGSLTPPSTSEVQVPRGSTLGKLKECICTKYGTAKPGLRLYRIISPGNITELLGDELRLADDFDMYLGETVHVGYNTLGLPWNPIQKLEYLYGKPLQTVARDAGGAAVLGFPPALGEVGGVASMLVGMKHSSPAHQSNPSAPKEKGIKIKKRMEKN